MKILVRNLDRETKEKDLLALFEVHGKVESCKIVMDEASGLSKGFAFVVMAKPHEGKAAVKALNGKELDGYKIRVKKTAPKKPPAPSKKK